MRAATLEFGHDCRSAYSVAGDDRWFVDRNSANLRSQSLKKE